jgi:hypothetical protein
VGVLPVRWWVGRTVGYSRTAATGGTLWQTAILINPAGVDCCKALPAGRY